MRTLRVFCAATLAVAAAAFSTSATATIFNWTAVIDQAQEVPAPTPVPGAMGTAFGTIDDVTNILIFDISWQGLSGSGATAVHFHGPAGPGATAPVQVNVSGQLGSTTSPLASFVELEPDGVAELLAGLWYINIHTEQNPGGEIRGQVLISTAAPVSAPASLLLAAAGLVFLARRRRVSA